MIPNKHHGRKAREYHQRQFHDKKTISELEMKQRQVRQEAWEHCFGNKTLSQIADEISKKYP